MNNLLMHPTISRAVSCGGGGQGVAILIGTRKHCAEGAAAARNGREEAEARGGRPANYDRGDLVEVPQTTEDWLRRRVRLALDEGDLPNEPCVSRKGRHYPGLADACREFLGEARS